MQFIAAEHMHPQRIDQRAQQCRAGRGQLCTHRMSSDRWIP
jgi:hypothetical protein